MIFEKLKYPILQAPIGSLATTKLAAAVSNAGGMGSLALTWTEPDVAQQRGILETCLYAGTGCGRMDHISGAAKLMADIWAEYQAEENIE